jgi:hypothetical protein
MQRKFDAVHAQYFAVFKCLQTDIATQAQAQNGSRHPVSEVMPVTRPGMVGMGMGDDGSVYRFPGIDIEIALFTVKPFVGEAD